MNNENGNIIFDATTGEARLKSFVECSGVTLSREVIGHCLDFIEAVLDINDGGLLDFISMLI